RQHAEAEVGRGLTTKDTKNTKADQEGEVWLELFSPSWSAFVFFVSFVVNSSSNLHTRGASRRGRRGGHPPAPGRRGSACPGSTPGRVPCSRPARRRSALGRRLRSARAGHRPPPGATTRRSSPRSTSRCPSSTPRSATGRCPRQNGRGRRRG